MRGISTVGSARHSHCRGQGFESPMLHFINIIRTNCSLWAMGSDFFFISNQTNLHQSPDEDPAGQEKPYNKRKEGHQTCIRPGTPPSIFRPPRWARHCSFQPSWPAHAATGQIPADLPRTQRRQRCPGMCVKMIVTIYLVRLFYFLTVPLSMFRAAFSSASLALWVRSTSSPAFTSALTGHGRRIPSDGHPLGHIPQSNCSFLLK